jgi:NAD(P)-dependent dehydrogenase (short-subunit alcohol dehydrogenase family)
MAVEMSMDAFTDKIVVITGGASGIGRALGEELGRSGARVILADINADLLSETGDQLIASGYQVATAALDVRNFEAVKRLIEETAREHGRIDYLFNNAGIAVAGEVRDVSLDDWRGVIDTSLYGVVHGVVAAYPIMLKQGSGHIINTASLAGLIPASGEVSYSAAKYGIVGLSHSLRAEAADLGVRVSVVCPGFIQTPIFHTSEVVKLDRERLLAEIPKAMPADQCARDILRGVERNKATIVVTASGKVFWRLYRYTPWLLNLLFRRSVRKMREMRIEE